VIVKEREMRNEARAMMKRKLGAKAIEGKDIDHKDPVRAKDGHVATTCRTFAYDRVTPIAVGKRSNFTK
jgi:hypothetical protein